MPSALDLNRTELPAARLASVGFSFELHHSRQCYLVRPCGVEGNLQ